jgi:hypothetical protein
MNISTNENTKIESSTYLLYQENSYLSSVGTSRQRHKYSASLAICLWFAIYWVVSLKVGLSGCFKARPPWVCLEISFQLKHSSNTSFKLT